MLPSTYHHDNWQNKLSPGIIYVAYSSLRVKNVINMFALSRVSSNILEILKSMNLLS